MQKIKKVLLKFPADEVRDLTRDYMKFYQNIHATERPRDISSINVPFILNLSQETLCKYRRPQDWKARSYLPHEETKIQPE